MPRPDWYVRTIRRLYQYPLDRKRLEVLQARMDSLFPAGTANYSQAPVYTGPGDQTGNLGSKRADVDNEMRELKLRVKEMEIVLGSFNFESRKLIELRYFEGGKADFIVYNEMHMAQATYYRLRDRLIQNIAVILGFYAEPQISIEERMITF